MALASGVGCAEDRGEERTDSAAVARTNPGAVAAANAPGDTTGSRITIPGRDPEDGQWLRPAKDYASTRFSELAEITTA
ncbi:MAG: hypothetical protein K0S86_4611, partial [Geminicoccaceae bacterium]|nr:hypothetical protein [Geminicoccaceae bacterium]